MTNLRSNGQKGWLFFSAFHDYVTLASSHTLSARHRPKRHALRPFQQDRWTSTTSSESSPSPHRQRKHQQQQQQQQPSIPAASAPHTYYSFFPNSLPLGAPPRGPFGLDPAALRREFLSLQSRAHPDMHPAGPDKARAEGMSARINDAYRTLLSPLRRAEYILSLQGGEEEGSNNGAQERVEGEEGGFLAEVLDVRERIEEAEAGEEVEELGRENEERVKGCENVLAELLQEGRWEEARKEVARLRYWMGIRDVVQSWGEDRQGDSGENMALKEDS